MYLILAHVIQDMSELAVKTSHVQVGILNFSFFVMGFNLEKLTLISLFI